MHELGVEPHIVEAVLNHISGHKAGVAGTYNHALYASPKRAALALWAGPHRLDYGTQRVPGGADAQGIKPASRPNKRPTGRPAAAGPGGPQDGA
jgi:hypothetical protein